MPWLFAAFPPHQQPLEMSWSSSLNRWRNCKRRLTWKERDLGSTLEKHKVLISGPVLDGFQKSSKDPCASRASAQTPFSVVVVPVGSTRDAVVSLALWSLIPASGVNVVLDRPMRVVDDKPMTLRGHNGQGETWVGAILLLPRGLLILRMRWRLWSHFHHTETPCRMGQIQWAPVCPNRPLISYQRNLHPNLIWGRVLYSNLGLSLT